MIDLQNGIIPTNGVTKLAEIINESFIISFITYIKTLGYKDASQQLEEFISLADVIEVNKFIIDQTISIRKTNRIKLPDAIIAATAMVHSFTLVTNNTNDFKKIEGLNLLNPYSL